MQHQVIFSHRDLLVWQKSMDLVVHIYQFTEHFPVQEMYGLTSQMRRAATSIPSNIAEGRKRGSRRDFRKFVLIAFASGAELETQLEIAKRLSFGNLKHLDGIDHLLNEIMRMLNSLLASLGKSPRKLRS
jgi:four helix bundle protein